MTDHSPSDQAETSAFERNRIRAVDRVLGFTRSGFVRGVAVLSSGQMIATLLQLFVAPVTSRLYLPVEYGVLGSYMAVASVLAAIGNWQFSQGVIVEARENKAYAMVRLCTVTSFITAIVSLLIGLAIFYFPSEIGKSERAWFLLLPLTTLVGGTSSAWGAMANRRKQYRIMSMVPVATVVLGSGTTVALGFAGADHKGLFAGYFLSQVATAAIFGYAFFQLPDRKSQTYSKNRLASLARKHRRFALYSSPAAFVGNFAMSLPVYALGILAATDTIGLFNRARQLASMPVMLLGGSIARVFQQRASEDHARDGGCRRIFKLTFAALLGIGILPTIVLASFAPQLFGFVLGANWVESGHVARILSPMLLLRLICSPLSTVFSIAGKQREDFWLSVVSVAITFVCVAIPLWFRWDPIWITVGFSTAFSITYTTYIVRGFQASTCTHPMSVG